MRLIRLTFYSLLLTEASSFQVFNSVHGNIQRPQITNGEIQLQNPSPTTSQPNPTANGDNNSSNDTHDSFDVWTQVRTGLRPGPGSSPSVFWVGGGALYEGFSGEQLAIFEGFDVGRGVQLNENHVRQISRKIFWFRDPNTGEIMTEYNGTPVSPIVYDCQVIDYHRDTTDGSITYSVVASLRDLKDMPKMKITSTAAGPSQLLIHVPVFVDVPSPTSEGGRYRAWEFYDYTVDPTYPKERPATAIWCRQGSVPPFRKEENAVLRFSGHRVDRFEELPERMRVLVEEEWPHFRYPPRDEEEVEELFGKRCR